MESKKIVGRKFEGKTSDFLDKTERHFFQRMLKHYIKGNRTFTFGRDATGLPVTYVVAQSYIHG